MARIAEPTSEQLDAWLEWLTDRPKVVRELAARFDPWSLYRMKSTGQRVTIAAFAEDGTLRVDVDPAYNLTIMGLSVFGIDPDDLEPCDLPDPSVVVGEVLSGDAQLAFINARREKNGLDPLIG